MSEHEVGPSENGGKTMASHLTSSYQNTQSDEQNKSQTLLANSQKTVRMKANTTASFR
jgi:hypothetical protein